MAAAEGCGATVVGAVEDDDDFDGTCGRTMR
jgi:hypothetical protein